MASRLSDSAAPSRCSHSQATPINVSHILARRSPSKPLAYLPCGRQPSIAVRFCPVLFKLAGASAEAAANNHSEHAEGQQIVMCHVCLTRQRDCARHDSFIEETTP